MFVVLYMVTLATDRPPGPLQSLFEFLILIYVYEISENIEKLIFM